MSNATASACTLVNTALVIGGSTSGTFLVGQTITAPGVPPGVTIVSQTTGTTGSTGNYVATPSSANVNVAEAFTFSLSWIRPLLGNSAGPQSNLFDLGRAAGFGFVVGMCVQGPTATPGAEYQHGAHAVAIYNSQAGGRVFPSVYSKQSVSVGQQHIFAQPQYVDPPQPSISHAQEAVGEVHNIIQRTLIAGPAAV